MQKQTLRNKVFNVALATAILTGASWAVTTPVLAYSKTAKSTHSAHKTARGTYHHASHKTRGNHDTAKPTLVADHVVATGKTTQSSLAADGKTQLLISTGHDQADQTATASDDATKVKLDSSNAGNPPASKAAFVQQILTSTDAVNANVLRERAHLLKLQAKNAQGKVLSPRDQSWLNELASEYKVSNPDWNQTKTWTDMSQRVDAIPPSLVLGQSIQESGWGGSSIAKRAHNYFGQTCAHAGCYPGTRYQQFVSMQAAVAAYIHNLNSNYAYQALRQLRFQARNANLSPNSVVMANGLNAYSELHGRYISAIKTVITRFHLQQYDTAIA